MSHFTSDNLRIHCRTQDDGPTLRGLLENPDAALMGADSQILKDDATTTLGIVCCENRKLVVKRYNTKNYWHRIRRTLRQSRAENCWYFAHWLQGMDIAAALAVAWIQEIRGGLKGRSWFVSEFVDGPTCLDHIKTDVIPAEKILGEIIDVLCKLRHHRISHGDLKATNILLSKQGPVLIDLDVMRQHSSDSAYQQAVRKDVNRFLRNWQDYPVLLETARRLLSNQNFPI